jgi:hypothetical protein
MTSGRAPVELALSLSGGDLAADERPGFEDPLEAEVRFLIRFFPRLLDVGRSSRSVRRFLFTHLDLGSEPSANPAIPPATTFQQDVSHAPATPEA